MTPIDCATARDDIDAYALGALDAEEARALGAHLAGCPACSRELERAAEAGPPALALSAPLVASAPALKARVLASAAVLGELQGSRRRFHWWHAAAAVLVVALAGAFSWGLAMQLRVGRLEDRNAVLRVDATVQATELDSVRADLRTASAVGAGLTDTVAMQNAIVDLMAEPDVRRTPMRGTAAAPGANGHYVWSPARDTGALVAGGLAPLAAGMRYQMWVVYTDRRWVSEGSFEPDAAGSARLIVHGTPNDEAPGTVPSWFCVTIEPAGAGTGSGTMVLRSPAQ